MDNARGGAAVAREQQTPREAPRQGDPLEREVIADEARIEQPGVNEHTAPVDEEIALRAYELYLARGGAHGYDLEDWLEAQRQLSDPGDRDVLAHE
jgi:hypothetical protein